MWTVVEVHDDSARGMSVRTFGLYDDPEQAERERRDLHMGYVLKQMYRPPRTFVTRVEGMRR